MFVFHDIITTCGVNVKVDMVINELVERLAHGNHEVVFEDRVKDLKRVKERIEDGFVFVKFTKTRGGTELGIDLLKDESDFSCADFVGCTGKLHIVGICELNYNKIKCVADVDLKTRKGVGHLEVLGE